MNSMANCFSVILNSNTSGRNSEKSSYFEQTLSSKR